MKDKYEVLVTGDTGGGLGVWDPSTGNSLHQYKGGVNRANTATWIKQVNKYWITSLYLCLFVSSQFL